MRHGMEHIRHRAARRHPVHRDFLVPAVLGEHAHERLDGGFGARVERVFRHGEVLDRVRRHEDDPAAVVEVAVGLASDKELCPRVDTEDPVEFVLM